MNRNHLGTDTLRPPDAPHFDRSTGAEKGEAPAADWAAATLHDLNNMITVILGNSRKLNLTLDSNAQARSAAEQIEKASFQAAELSRQLLRQARSRAPKTDFVPVNTLVDAVKRMAQPLMPPAIQWMTLLQPNLPLIRGDAEQLTQVLLNLVLNARDAMTDGGQLWVATAGLTDDQFLPGQAPLPPGRWVCLTVSDTGRGMNEETQARLFERYATTKPDGNGLGLTIVQDVVRAHGGLVRVTSRLGSGTSFTLCFPAAVEPEPTLPRPEFAAARPQASGRVGETLLLVEDHDAVRALAASVLSRQGYTVLAVRHGLEALQVCNLHTGPIHLLLSDLIMPGMDGRKLALVLTQMRSDLRVLFTSGSLTQGHVTCDPDLRDAAFLPKPFRPDDLLTAVRRVLDRQPS